ncbi:putative heme-binding domain-containing protein [Algoriphagus locisalis]|uniref:Putative heme-binding domain-containing protein n=1 Tax=Algoriphagus locisalis TaxID=305507 RepID=A0A1I7BLS1_9BACT|nr:HEAT repeat domain-containing protein [Algoriphagus locisalis]SFT88112.1 putative heme-binding domain-containing protein [Algoriphagus locisalis]
MSKISLPILALVGSALAFGCSSPDTRKADLEELTNYYPQFPLDTAKHGADSTELIMTNFAGPDIVPSPAALAVSPNGNVFVGVDMMGSLGKEPGKGAIVRLVDSNNDGELDSHTEFVKVDNPRGIIAVRDQVFVLHTQFSEETGEAEGMNLVVFEDKDNDGVADGPSKLLIEGISSPASLRSRGTDHSTNGIRMGIDGWIYIAVGDFGFHNATDRDGTQMTMLGGGIVRVRPDGTEMEEYIHGTRNIYDVAIDPFMNIYTRGNTNDGGGWNIRFIHYTQSGEYGYPNFFKNFTEETIPALVDLGGGSGTGSYFMDDDRWPAKYNHVPMMADWGRSQLYIHRVTMDGAGFTQQDEEFIKLAQITDIDLDASGRMFLAAWDGAGYFGSDEKGYVVRVVPKDWTYEAFPDLTKATVEELTELLKATNSVSRFHAQRELLSRFPEEAGAAALSVATDKSLSLESRVAGIYTYAQATCGSGSEELVKLSQEEKVREFALRALADRKTCLQGVPLEPFIEGVSDPNDRVKSAAIVALGRIGNPEAAEELLKVKVPASFEQPEKGTEGPHATPNSAIILPHVAVKSLVALNAVDAAVDAIGTEDSKLALWALRYMHDPKAVNGLIDAYRDTDDAELKLEILGTLSRLYKKEAPYDGSWWWGTRPDTHGPYYKGITWESSDQIKDFLVGERSSFDAEKRQFFAELNERNRMDIEEFGEEESNLVIQETEVDLEEIKNKKGQVGAASIEDVMIAVQDLKGDPVKGKALFTSQGCIACHSIEKGQPLKGPFMGQIGSIMNRSQITESILKPNASISQGFASVLIDTNDDKSYMGFVTAETADEVVIQDITGTATKLDKSTIKTRKVMETSMMPPGLANALSYEELASLITYLEQQK